jgi:hypothetical protein
MPFLEVRTIEISCDYTLVAVSFISYLNTVRLDILQLSSAYNALSACVVV